MSVTARSKPTTTTCFGPSNLNVVFGQTPPFLRFVGPCLQLAAINAVRELCELNRATLEPMSDIRHCINITGNALSCSALASVAERPSALPPGKGLPLRQSQNLNTTSGNTVRVGIGR